MSILGPSTVDPKKLSQRDYKSQRKAAHDLYNAFLHDALNDMIHKGIVTPDEYKTEVTYNEH